MPKGQDTLIRIERIKRALEHAQKLKAEAPLDAEPFREFLRPVWGSRNKDHDLIPPSWPTVRGWCDDNPELENEGVFLRGGRGTQWQIWPIGFLSALLEVYQQDASKRQERNRELQRKAGVTLPESEATADLDETRKLLAMTFDVNDRKIRQGLYTPADEAAEFIEGYNRAVVDAIMGVTTKIDPTGQLAPDIRAKVNEALIGVGSQVHEMAQKFVREQRARIQQTGVGLSG